MALFGRRRNQEPREEGRDVPVNEHLLDDVVGLLDGLGWSVYELWQASGEGDREDRMSFLIEWRNLRHALTADRPSEFNYYGAAHEWHGNIRFIFRDGSGFGGGAAERGFEAGQAEERSYREFLDAYDPGEDWRATGQEGDR
jgi:hypothetical protein